MLRVGFVGWRGMVGSVLMDRMKAENDFDGIESYFFSTSQVGQKAPELGNGPDDLKDGYDFETLKSLDVILTCQGGGYTTKVYPELRKQGWEGYWIDAASSLRMDDNSIIVLDPVNKDVIDDGLVSGIKTYVGGNCTVSLMLMALSGLFKADLIEWMTSMTYQAASGAGAKNMRELISQMKVIGNSTGSLLDDPSSAILDLDNKVTDILNGELPIDNFGAPLAGSLIPWIDSAVDDGQTREEWKGMVETNKILQREQLIPIDGICVRIGAMRSHSQALTIKLRKNLPLDEINQMIDEDNEWVEVVDNNKEDTLKKLTPAAISGTLKIPIGRIHKMNIGEEYLTAFTVGDQLLWGAAEPVRRMLNIVRDHLE
jgi:aspartate-semialdehyde dehydrogenase